MTKLAAGATSRAFVHDLKNQLNIVIGFSNLLLVELPTSDPTRADIEEIRKAGEAAMAIVESLDRS